MWNFCHNRVKLVFTDRHQDILDCDVGRSTVVFIIKDKNAGYYWCSNYGFGFVYKCKQNMYDLTAGKGCYYLSRCSKYEKLEVNIYTW